MRILLSGASGFIGSEVFFYFANLDHEVVRLRRGDPGLSDRSSLYWDPDGGSFLKEAFEGFDAVVHLAGERVMGRWTEEKKRRILSSRAVGTFLLSTILSQQLHPPKVFLSVSAMGIYGDRGDEVLTESSLLGRGFLASVCSEWEKASRPIRERGARVVHPRLGVALRSNGGMLKTMKPFYLCGLGGKLGSGNQWLSWIDLGDLARAIEFCLERDDIEGAVNFCSPNPIRQKDFSAAFAKHLHRPAFLRLPAWLLRCLAGEMADELLLSSERALPEKLLAAGFTFQHPNLEFRP